MPFWSSSNPNSGDSPDDSDPINDLIEKSKPILEKLTFSSFMGYCSAVSAKKIGKSVAFIVGLSFIGLQSLAHMGYIAVDWKKVEKSAMDLIDTVSTRLSHRFIVMRNSCMIFVDLNMVDNFLLVLLRCAY
mmetsp:Transcript_14086/g.29859  ORF Transcript_14086/g.29859 Transcript_14086/m.29859 type:complete len:131 (-) Transcript_14086:69-461(-)